ncbi:hypothetical protein IF1G_08708 [Cordyceps javanica]|uniref:GST N-terminal domain-containing protein n=1 Tax=Cordyceps javanica TaxID=43265 RepID=A0A545UTJ6_9HYPO|nr:hypothetical protein IF1G_08708 [Cordyceps javanica]TQW02099.1 hypothetical protein IF2G_10304 [Cordyceps javanica]
MQIYSFVGSQWAGVVHLALAEKGFAQGKDYDITEVDLGKKLAVPIFFTAPFVNKTTTRRAGNADNFDPAYLDINPNGTVPSLTAPSLPRPLIDSVDILRHLDGLRPETARRRPPLVPLDAASRDRGQQLIDLVHSPQLDTNILFFRARDAAELGARTKSWHKGFIDTRQRRLEEEHAAHPAHPFYGPKLEENGVIHAQYAAAAGVRANDNDAFFARSRELHREFADGMARLETLLVLPFAAGASLSEADLHLAPWLSHAMVAADSDIHQVQDFTALEKTIARSNPGFHVGPRTRQWWKTLASETSFQQVFPHLH